VGRLGKYGGDISIYNDEKSTMTPEITLFTIGFAGKSAEQFFGLLAQTGVRRVIDVRLYNSSQLAGYTKRSDLEYFLKTIIGADYVHLPIFAPTKAMLDGYKKGQITWLEYERQYQDILQHRQPHNKFDPAILDHACLLCAESTADQCHRRLAAEYLQSIWPNLAIKHL
jgi:uncharacterized protein (DUF488 family)